MSAQRPFPHHLVDPATTRELRARRNGPALLRLSMHVGALVVTGLLIEATRGSAWLALPLIAHGVLLVFLFAPLHETIHDTAFRTRALNRIAATLIGYVLLIPAAWFRHFHMAHHRLTNVPGDPERDELRITSLWRYVLQVSGLPLWRERITTLLRHAAGRVPETYVPPQRRVAVMAEAWAAILVYAAAAVAGITTGTWDDLLWLWVVPLLVGQPFLRAFLLAEHTGRPEVPDMLVNSRTTRSNAGVRWLAWNMPFHIEHHALPWVPFHALPRLHDALRPHLGEVSPGYLAFNKRLIGELTP